jgi:hypothetical protein
MIKQNVKSLHGFAWYAHGLPGATPPDSGECPYSGLDSAYRPLHWPIGPDVAGVRNRGPGPAFLVITPALTFGPPELGWKWQVEPAEFDDFRTEDGRVRLVDTVPRRTRWGIVAEWEFEAVSRPSEDSLSRPQCCTPIEGWDPAKPARAH